VRKAPTIPASHKNIPPLCAESGKNGQNDHLRPEQKDVFFQLEIDPVIFCFLKFIKCLYKTNQFLQRFRFKTNIMKVL